MELEEPLLGQIPHPLAEARFHQLGDLPDFTRYFSRQFAVSHVLLPNFRGELSWASHYIKGDMGRDERRFSLLAHTARLTPHPVLPPQGGKGRKREAREIRQ